MTTFTPVRTSAMYRAHLALGARFTADGSWKVAEVYTSADEEARVARFAVGLSDVSASGKLSVRGEAIEALFAKLTGLHTPLPGRALRVRIDGAPVLLGRVAPDEVLLLTSAADAETVVELMSEASEIVGCAHPTDLTSVLAAMDLLGPRAPVLLARLLALDLEAVPPLGVVQGEISRVHTLLIRLDRPALPVFRLLVGRELGEFTWHVLTEASHDLGLVPVGAAAHRRLVAED